MAHQWFSGFGLRERGPAHKEGHRPPLWIPPDGGHQRACGRRSRLPHLCGAATNLVDVSLVVG